MQTKKIVINFNYPDDADISLQEIQDKIKAEEKSTAVNKTGICAPRFL